MTKSEFKAKAELVWYSTRKTAPINKFAFYKAMQYRWEDNETADPQIGDESYHFTEAEAIKAADAINLDLGFEAQVERITINYDNFNDGVEFGEAFELSDLDDYRKFNCDRDTIYSGGYNAGKLLDRDAIIVFYRHHRYMGYAYTIESIEFVWQTRFKTESDLRNDADTTYSTYCHVVNDIFELADEFRDGTCVPFDKINKGSGIVREFLRDNKHPDFIDEEETEEI